MTDDTTKYYHMVAALDQDTSSRILGTLSAPPVDNKYTTLKQTLLNAFGLSKRDTKFFIVTVRLVKKNLPVRRGRCFRS